LRLEKRLLSCFKSSIAELKSELGRAAAGAAAGAADGAWTAGTLVDGGVHCVSTPFV
jgi:hypothetical protein